MQSNKIKFTTEEFSIVKECVKIIYETEMQIKNEFPECKERTDFKKMEDILNKLNTLLNIEE